MGQKRRGNAEMPFGITFPLSGGNKELVFRKDGYVYFKGQKKNSPAKKKPPQKNKTQNPT